MKPENPYLLGTVLEDTEVDPTNLMALISSDITLRDLFAGLCGAGLLAGREKGNTCSDDDYALCAYTLADALLAEREKVGEDTE